MGTRSVLINLLGDGGGASRALRGVGDDADRAARRVDDFDASNRRASEGGNVFTRSLESMAPAAGRAAASIGMVAAQAGAAIPAAAGLGAAVIAIAPAASVAATGIAAVGLAAGAMKIGMIGVGDAITQAFSAKGDPEKLAAAMKNLSPNARAFVGELIKLKPALDGLKTAVQDTLFQGLDKSFATAAKTTLPIFREGLVGAAQALNGMGKNLLSTIQGLGKSGALKTMFDGAVAGLKPLERIPGQLLKGFVQLGAAAAPIFARMTKGIGDAVTKVSDKLSGAFKSGALSGAIETAVGLLKELAGVGKNVFTIIKNIMSPAQATGGGTIGILKTITGELAKITGTPAFQQGLQALFGVMNNLATTAAPLLGQALAAIAPVLTALAPAANALIAALGQALQPVIAALGPVLVAAAQAVGQLVIALAPLLPVIGQVIAALLPVLVPVLQLLTTVLTALTPVIAVVAQALTTYLVPVITAVVGVVTTVVNWIKAAAEQAFPALASAVTSTGGPLAGLKQALSDLWAAVQPLATALWDLVQRVFVAIAPALTPVALALAEAGKVMIDVLAWAITNVVIPAINGLTALLSGEATKSIQGYAAAVGTAATSIVESMQGLTARTVPVVMQWAVKVGLAVKGMADAVMNTLGDLYDDAYQVMVKLGLRLPGALRAAVGAMKTAASAIGKAVIFALDATFPGLTWVVGNWVKGMVAILQAVVPRMFAIGKSIVGGLVSGIKSAVGGLMSTLQGITNMIPDWKGPAAKDRALLTPSGVMIMEGLNDGLMRGWGKTKDVLARMTDDVVNVVHGGIDGLRIARSFADLVPIGDLGKKLRQALTKGGDQIADVIKQIRAKIADAFKAGAITANQRDGLVDYLTSTNKKLQALSKEREKVVEKIKEITDYAKKITESVLSYAAITNIQGTEGAAPTGGQLVAGLQARLATIREFGANIKKLAGAGLSKALLRQILDAGIDGGAAIAAELANGPSSIIAALNTAQTQITKVAKGIGLDGADALFGSGKAMGDAFLKGLKSLEKALVDQMENLIDKLLKALGLGVDKAKKKVDELMILHAEAMKLADYNATPQQENNATPLKVAPKAPAPAPKPPTWQYITGSSNTGAKPVTINMGGVKVSGVGDIDALANRLSFAARSVSF